MNKQKKTIKKYVKETIILLSFKVLVNMPSSSDLKNKKAG